MFELKKIEAEWRARMHKALSFDGVDDYVEVQDSLELRLTDTFTLMAWVKPHHTDFKVYEGIINKKEKEYGYVLTFDHDRKVKVVVGDGTQAFTLIASQKTDWVAYEWYFIAATYSKSEGVAKIFVNGEIDNTRTITTSLGTSPRKVDIGQYGNHFYGIIAEVHIYNRALSASEIKYLYHNPFDPIDPEHLVLWLNPAGIDVANSKWWDLSGKGNHGTIHGATEVKLVEEEVKVK